MKPFQRSTTTIVGINFKLLYATILGVVAWVIWPTNMKWWGFGLLSVIIGAAAIGLVVNAVRAMVQLYLRDRAMETYLAQGGKPKTAELASDDTLRNSGMIDG